MDRRKVLLLVAAVIAALGTLLVFLYVQGADTRADQRYGAVTVLKAVKQIDPGETVETASQAGKFESATVSQQDLLTGAVNGLDPLEGKVATTTIYPGEQVVSSKFGAAGATGTSALTIPKGKLAISVNLGDPERVAGFVNPGSKVAIFCSTEKSVRLLLPSVEVIGAGTTTMTPTTTTATDGTQSTEQLPRALLTLATSQSEAEKIIYCSKYMNVTFGLLNDESQVAASAGIGVSTLFN